MFIHEISLYNFGVYAGPETIRPCSLHEGEKPVTLIGGINGAGKTTILEAILLALYGKTSPAVRKAGQPYQAYIESYMHYMHTNIKTEAWVELLLEVPVDRQNVSLRLRRQWQYKKNQWKEDFRVTLNDVPDLFLAKNWAYYVEDLIPSGLAELFFFDGEKIINIAEEETNSAMKKAIYSVFGIDLVDRLVQDMGRLIKRHESNLYPAEMKKEIYYLERSGQELLEQLRVVKQELAGVDTRLERLLEKARQKEEQILKGGGNWQEERQSLVITKELLKEKMAESRAEMIALAGGALPLSMVKHLLMNLEEQMRHDQASKIAAQALPIVNQQGQQILKLLLEGGAKNRLVAQVQDAIDQRENELNNLAARISPIYISELVLNQVEQLTGSKLGNLQSKAVGLINNYRSMEDELEQVERHLLVEVDHSGLEQEMRDYKEFQQAIIVLSVDRQVLSDRLTELNKNFSEIEIKHQVFLHKHLTKVEENEESARIINYALRTKETMAIFRKKLIERKTKRLSTSMQEAFQYLAHKKSLVDKVEIDPHSLNIKLYDKNGLEVSKQRLAAGEKQMLAISLLWGLAHSSGRMLPMIIDTPMGRLDSSHRQNFVSRYLPEASHQVIVLSTDTEINGELYILLHEHVGQEYWLDYSDQSQSTIIRKGYFQSSDRVEGDYDSQANQAVQPS